MTIGKKSGPPPKKGPNSSIPPIKFGSGGMKCPHRDTTEKILILEIMKYKLKVLNL